MRWSRNSRSAVLALQQSHREIKYRNNIVEQDYRAIKRVVRPMLSLAS